MNQTSADVALAALNLLGCPGAEADTLYVSSVNGNKVYRVTTNGTVSAFATINYQYQFLSVH